ncbi:hypothetical protein HELRODRAFT_170189 [Helobdella robusta]|uniref:Peptidase S1 domain-containing protein n=1 Tax=Helobdella robusta TaxID=6412 RepID=T1F2R9_HELRO|nr:hypothetical protein HELRODRAFT_170189 [Helobdella robusta]ESO07662.1 hypothetical protein HELRODRAFT_170189 [Helobdella robusta]
MFPRYFNVLKFLNRKSNYSCPNNLVVSLTCLSHDCGSRHVKTGNFRSKYIIYGDKVAKGEYPWQVKLNCGRQLCGGSVIRSDWIITAAHCVMLNKAIFNTKDCTVAVGAVYMNDHNWLLYGAEALLPHKDYVEKNHENDIALIKLKRKINISPYVQTICLPKKPYSKEDFSYCISSGFGKTIRDQVSHTLLQQRMIIRNDCGLLRLQQKSGFYNKSSKLCVGTTGDYYQESTISTCLGDSGGPFVCRSATEDRWTLFGVHSFVSGVITDLETDSCKQSFESNVYKYMDWITTTISLHKRNATDDAV